MMAQKTGLKFWNLKNNYTVKKISRIKVFVFPLLMTLFSCGAGDSIKQTHPDSTVTIIPPVIQPVLITDTVPNDTDDPAIWVDSANPANSLVIGTDKDENGGLYVFNLNGRMDTGRSIRNLKRPNNVDVEYGLLLKGKKVDIAVTTERLTHQLRVFSLPDMKPIDNGGIPVFVGQTAEGFRDLMGIALYRNSAGKIFAIVGRKTGPLDSTYLWQYELKDNGKGIVVAHLVRKFGKYSGIKEIEAIAVDDESGFVYYSDEGVGIRKYYADPEKGNNELALFGTTDFVQDHEGISIYKTGSKSGFILVSNQQDSSFNIYPREGTANNPHLHTLIKKVKVSASESDGSEIIAIPLNEKFRFGLFVAMSDDKTFHFYLPEQILSDSLLRQ
jgi:3-phytase